MDGLSVAASIIAVVQVSWQVLGLCQTYYMEVKEARGDIKCLRNEMTSLGDVLTNLADLTEGPESAILPTLRQLNRHDGPVQKCHQDLIELVAKLEAGQKRDHMKKFGLRALKWPFSKKDVVRLLAIIEKHKATFNLALTVDGA